MNINILICSPGERHEDCIPEKYCSLDKLKETIKELSDNCDGEGFCDYKIFVLIPNKKVTLKGGDCDIYFDYYCDDYYKEETLIANNQKVTYAEFEKKIVDIYNEKNED